ncbi:hypothetical protein DRP04_01045 [Archaeoglobales archaeon]|nr:MAG: hypothetical protein DRP04_01045 [Archaeoglobales archaeon]
MKRHAAIFIDEENIYNWVYQHRCPELESLPKSKRPGLEFHKYFDINKLWEYLSERGLKISKAVCFIAQSGLNPYVVRRLYEWGVIVIPAIRYEYKYGENTELKSLLDAMMIVEILTTAYENKHIETFVIISGDKDFYPVAMKLRELGKEVIIIGPDEDTADILKTNFEFIDVAMFVNLTE